MVLVKSMPLSDADKFCVMADEDNSNGIADSKAWSPSRAEFSDVEMQRHGRNLDNPKNILILKVMSLMTMKTREKGSIDGRGEHSTLLGRWFKSEPISLQTIKDRSKALEWGSIASSHDNESQCLTLEACKNNKNKWSDSKILEWPLTKKALEKNLCRIKLRKFIVKKSPMVF